MRRSKQLWLAGAALGAMVLSMAATAAASPLTIVVTGNIIGGGIVAVNTAPGPITITMEPGSSVLDPGPPLQPNAISATASNGAITIIDNGDLTAVHGDGVDATTPSDNPILVEMNKSFVADGANGVNANNTGAGSAAVTVASGTAKAPLTIGDPTVAGLVAQSATGQASVSIGSNIDITSGSAGTSGVSGINATAVDTSADASGPTVSVSVGQNDTLNLSGNDGAAILSRVGMAGVSGPSGTASDVVTTGNGLAINASGFDDAGVEAYTADLSGAGTYASGGAITLSVGTGSINVNETGASGSPSGPARNAGIEAVSGSGDVIVINSAKLTVSGGEDSSSGIFAETGGSGLLSVESSAAITSANGDGVDAFSQNGLDLVTIAGGKVVASGDAVNAQSANGAINVTIGSGATVQSTTPGSDWAVLGDASGSGDVTLNVTGKVVDGGVEAISNQGAASIAVGVDTNSNGSGAVAVAFGSRPASITNSGTVTATGAGLLALSSFGSAMATVDAAVTSSGAEGVLVIGDGASVATASGASTGTINISGQDAIVAVSGGQGAALVDLGDWNKITAGAAGDDGVQGVLAQSNAEADAGAPSAQVLTGANDTVTVKGNDTQGIAAQNLLGAAGVGSANVQTGAALTLKVSGFDVEGVQASSGGGAASVVTGTGTITVNESGATGAASDGSTNVGLAAISQGGAASITNNATVNVTGGVDSTVGLLASTSGQGVANVAVDAPVNSHQGDGVRTTTGAGANTVTVNSTITAGQGSAVNASGIGTVQVTVAAGGMLSGKTGVTATSTGGAAQVTDDGVIAGGAGGAVVLSSATQGTLTIGTGITLTAPGAATSPTVQAAGAGLLDVDNSGTLTTNKVNHTGLAVLAANTGGMILTNEAGATLDGVVRGSDNVTLNNLGTWQTAGTSDFGTPAGAATNTLQNFGTIVIGQNGSPATSASAASFLDLGAFHNGGFVTAGAITMVNGKVGDTLTVSGPFIAGAGGSELALDAALGGPGSKADELILQGGSSGQTLIQINDTTPGAGALNPKGIVLVVGATAASNFALDPGQTGYDASLHGIDNGLFVYPLAFVSGNEVLLGEPGQSAAQMATMASAAEDIWSSTTPGDESAADLRLSLANPDTAGVNGPHLWARALNGGANRLNGGDTLMGQAAFGASPDIASGPPLQGVTQQTQNFSAYGMTYGFNTGYAQNVSALETGLDLGRHVGSADAWSWGLTTGYLESQQSFNTGSSVAQYQGALLAMHGAYVNTNGFYVAGDAKVTALQVSYATSWGGGVGAPTTGIDTFGAEADAGWRRALGGAWSVEPTASISMQSSQMGQLVIQGTPVSFGDSASVRLGFGAKLDGAATVFGRMVKNETSLKVWDELEGANTLDLGGADGFVLPDQIGGMFADATDAVSLESADGKRSAFVSGAYRWSASYEAAQVAAGFKLRW
ncbi:MAG TPA: hypothetical protein VGL58_10900 [Caulobacteraceae bacterium]|jgi:hypothetical protein